MGGKTYLFALYQGYRYPNSEIYTRPVPSPNMRNGIVTFGGTTYDLAAIDPRHIGINPVVQQMWNKYEPAGIAGCPDIAGATCDGVNEYEFKAPLNLPTKDNFLVGRLDHDFSDKWHFMTSYRYYKLTQASTSQVDIGGFFTGDKLGTPASVASRPQQPWYLVAGLTTNITSRLTNDFHYSFLRNYWSWSDQNAPPQVSGLGGALEPFGESATTVLAPFNVNTQIDPHPLLGRPRQLLPRRPHSGQGQSPVHLRRPISAQLQLPPALRQWRRHQLHPHLPARIEWRNGRGKPRPFGIAGHRAIRPDPRPAA